MVQKLPRKDVAVATVAIVSLILASSPVARGRAQEKVGMSLDPPPNDPEPPSRKPTKCLKSSDDGHAWTEKLKLAQRSRAGVPICDCLAVDPFAFEEDGFSPPEVNVGRVEIVEALVIAVGVVALDEDLALEIAGQVVVFKQVTVLERLMPAPDHPPWVCG